MRVAMWGAGASTFDLLWLEYAEAAAAMSLSLGSLHQGRGRGRGIWKWEGHLEANGCDMERQGTSWMNVRVLHATAARGDEFAGYEAVEQAIDATCEQRSKHVQQTHPATSSGLKRVAAGSRSWLSVM